MEQEIFWYEVENGALIDNWWYTYCPDCGKYINCSHPHIEHENIVFCGDCAYIRGLISEYELCDAFYFWTPDRPENMRVCIHDGKVHVADKSYKFPWERSKDEQRRTTEYTKWRKAVYERDNYTCAICGQVGGKLNAHHIKPFSKYKELRTSLENGITLCETCHKRVHKEKNSEWLHID